MARLLGSAAWSEIDTTNQSESKIVGYYALASGAMNVAVAPGRFRRNMPDPIPIVVLARLAVDRTYQGRNLGRALVRDAARRILHAADAIGIRGIIVHAISDEAKAFYLAFGFELSPIEPMTLMITLTDIAPTRYKRVQFVRKLLAVHLRPPR